MASASMPGTGPACAPRESRGTMSDKPRRHRPPERSALTSGATRSAAAAVLAAHGWTEDQQYRIRTTAVSRDDVIIAPIVDGADVMPGTVYAEWTGRAHKRNWFEAARRLAAWMEAAGWTTLGTASRGTWFRRPIGDAAQLAAAPAGAGVRLAAIADEIGVSGEELTAAVLSVWQDQAPADRPEKAAIIGRERGRQLRFLFEQCGSEAGVRAVLAAFTGQQEQA